MPTTIAKDDEIQALKEGLLALGYVVSHEAGYWAITPIRDRPQLPWAHFSVVADDLTIYRMLFREALKVAGVDT